MVAQIKLKKLTGVNVESGSSSSKTIVKMDTHNQANFATEVKKVINNADKITFSGQDYKGTFTVTDARSAIGNLELYLERPENYFKIGGIKIKTTGSNHAYDGKTATIDIEVTDPKIIEKDSGWFTTELTGTASALKFGEWNDYDLPDKCYVEIDFT